MTSTAKQLARIGLSVGLLGGGSYYSVKFIEQQLTDVIIQSTVESIQDPEVQAEVYQLFVKLLNKLMDDPATFDKSVEFLIKVIKDPRFEDAVVDTLVDLLNARPAQREGVNVMRFIFQSLLYEFKVRKLLVSAISRRTLQPRKAVVKPFKHPFYKSYRLARPNWTQAIEKFQQLVLLREAQYLVKVWVKEGAFDLRTLSKETYMPPRFRTDLPMDMKRSVDIVRVLCYKTSPVMLSKIIVPQPVFPTSRLSIIENSIKMSSIQVPSLDKLRYRIQKLPQNRLDFFAPLTTSIFEQEAIEMPSTLNQPPPKALDEGSLEIQTDLYTIEPAQVSTLKIALPPHSPSTMPRELLNKQVVGTVMASDKHLKMLVEAKPATVVLKEPLEHVETHYIKY